MKNNLVKFNPVEKSFSSLSGDIRISSKLQENILEVSGLIKDINQIFPCPGARKVFNNGDIYASEHSGDMKSLSTAQDVMNSILLYSEHTDLISLRDAKAMKDMKYQTFLSVFPEEFFLDPLDGASKVHTLLKNILDLDTNKISEEGFSRDPNDPNFSMHVDGIPFFPLAFNPTVSNTPRETNKAIAINWNTHYIFSLLKINKKFQLWENMVRGKIKKNHGEVHGDLQGHNTVSEISQYFLANSPYRERLGNMVADIYKLPDDSHVRVTPDRYK